MSGARGVTGRDLSGGPPRAGATLAAALAWFAALVVAAYGLAALELSLLASR